MNNCFSSVLAINIAMFFFWGILLHCITVVTQELCRELSFVGVYKNKSINKSIIKNITVQDEELCQWKCFLDDTCKSYNLGPPQVGEEGKRVCELSSSHHVLHPEYLVSRPGFIYRSSVNPCGVPCPEKQSCLSVDNTATYSCLCPDPGFTGNTCTEDIDECVANNDCAAEANCTNTAGSFICTCLEGYQGNGKTCQGPVGSFPELPAYSCGEIKASRGGQVVSGNYWLDLEKNGNPLKVYCDMTTDGGGWLLVSNVVIGNSSASLHLSLETSYWGISSYYNNKTVLTTNAMMELRSHLPFTQLRFHCNKHHHGRTFHVTTVANSTGEAVVQYFSGQTSVKPNACGSFVRMDDDDSILAGLCYEWGVENGSFYVGKWGGFWNQGSLYEHSAFVFNRYHWLLFENGARLECDDRFVGVSSDDFWKVFVR